jgi:hypothetical protein
MADLAQGNFVLVPPLTAAASYNGNAWWRVDSRTGITLGVDSQGRGTAAAEYSQALRSVIFATCFYRAVSAKVAGNNMGALRGVLCMAAAAGGFVATEAGAASNLAVFGAVGLAASLLSQLLQ